MPAETRARTVRATGANKAALHQQRGANLDELLQRRFALLQAHLAAGSRVLELGAGIGETRRHLPGIDLVQTDVEANPWLDASVSAECLPFDDGAFDAVVALNVFHHLGRPKRALAECLRVIRPGGRIIIWESHASRLLRALLAIRGHEYVDFSVDPFGEATCQRSEDNWDGNNAIADLLFGNRKRLSADFPTLQLIHHRYVECLVFMNSGGVNHKAPYIPLPRFMVRAMAAFDRLLCSAAPDAFALGQELVYLKKAG